MLLPKFYGKTISIAGLCKNAGKTTLLNEIIRQYDNPLAITSIGLDGETKDSVTGTNKPRIYIHKGTIFATAADTLIDCDCTREILHTFDINTPVGTIAAVRALSDGYIKIAGASTVNELITIRDYFLSQNIERVLIDGALSRISNASAKLCDSIALCTGAALSSDIREVIYKTAYEAMLLTLPQADENEKCIYLYGAVTDKALIEEVKKAKEPSVFVAEDNSKLLISPSVYNMLVKSGHKLKVKKTIKLCLITINPYSPKGLNFNPDEFLYRMRESIPSDIPIADIHRDIIL